MKARGLHLAFMFMPSRVLSFREDLLSAARWIERGFRLRPRSLPSAGHLPHLSATSKE
jgi:hypothetical protein